MGNNTSASELTRQGALLGEKLRRADLNDDKQGSESTVPSPRAGKQVKYTQGLSLQKMQRIQKQIEFEYPFLSNVYESILVTDNRLPDCPIGTPSQPFFFITPTTLSFLNCTFE